MPKTRLEESYLLHKQKHRTKVQVALEIGLGDLTNDLFSHLLLTPYTEAVHLIDASKGIADVKVALK